MTSALSDRAASDRAASDRASTGAPSGTRNPLPEDTALAESFFTYLATIPPLARFVPGDALRTQRAEQQGH